MMMKLLKQQFEKKEFSPTGPKVGGLYKHSNQFKSLSSPLVLFSFSYELVHISLLDAYLSILTVLPSLFVIFLEGGSWSSPVEQRV